MAKEVKKITGDWTKSIIRHFERITENCKASPSDIKTSEALRLGKKDVIKLKRFINKKV